ncbi:sulfurtransferase TusA family protein [Gilvimarinus sp. SDUM040013]|uniref:Sulfurtransferase TusA family protein n=1 Tax=Gilvimarinus gilvus TaxID=3058038 RepID=A0ABU4RYP4_9GAMM|nr:sulfurtransferase TusA family protein [Gilvimarinus sp. SDUM040013]MDO3386307.1 sulfurtransferase TusA family protein [Gilvimarinus sp. SDUM040013]MDX6850035.1 sulfurtransferase TusA family protein [Gilvimarinus sp. SDUM040013]
MTECKNGSSTEYNPELLDARDLRCPMPLLRAKQALNKMVAGDVLEVIATDAGSVRDLAAYCELSVHTLLEQREEEGVYIHIIRKGAEAKAAGQEQK